MMGKAIKCSKYTLIHVLTNTKGTHGLRSVFSVCVCVCFLLTKSLSGPLMF